MEPFDWTLKEAIDRLRSHEVSSVELTREALDRIQSSQPVLSAYVSLLDERALACAQKADRDLKNGNPGPLAGVPIAVKDLFCMAGTQTTAGSKILENFIAPYDSTVTAKLEAAGAVICGKTAMDEFAMGSSGENCAFGITKNPWDTDFVPGGSSSGSAVAVAARTVFGSVGTDTGGSIRQPASHCGVVGMKPTYGRVSRWGMIAFASSLDQAGPFGRSVWDVARLLSVISGNDPKDATCSDRPAVDFAKNLNPDVSKMTIGIPGEYFVEGIDPEVESAIRGAIEKLEQLGAQIRPIHLPHTEYAVAAYYIMAPAQASSNLARFDGMRYGLRETGSDLLETYWLSRAKGFGREVRRRIMVGTFALSAGYYDAYYGKAQQVRTLIRRDFDDAFEKVDVIAAPTCPEPAFRLGERIDDPLSMYLSDALTIPVNLAGLPGLSIPCGFSSRGLPIGLQIIGPSFGEQVVLNAASAYENVTDFLRQPPPVR